MTAIIKSAAAKTVQSDLRTVQADAQWFHDNKGTATAQEIDQHATQAEKDWEKFQGDAAGLQNSTDPGDKSYAAASYTAASSAFRSTQGDLKEILGGTLNGALQSGDATAKHIQSETMSLIDQGNAATEHWQALLNQHGHNVSTEPVEGGTASPNTVTAQSTQVWAQNFNPFAR